MPLLAGEVVVQGEDLGRWVQGCRFEWERLLPAQQWLLENALGLEPAEESERSVTKGREALRAALRALGGVKLGMVLGNIRQRANKLPDERRAELGWL
ncbi:hypothetical protein [Streptomyces sp. NPDC054863]